MNRKIILLTQFILSFGGGMPNIALLTLITKWFVSANYVGIYSFCLFVPRVLLALVTMFVLLSKQISSDLDLE